jgi:hypothetical protein
MRGAQIFVLAEEQKWLFPPLEMDNTPTNFDDNICFLNIKNYLKGTDHSVRHVSSS